MMHNILKHPCPEWNLHFTLNSTNMCGHYETQIEKTVQESWSVQGSVPLFSLRD